MVQRVVLQAKGFVLEGVNVCVLFYLFFSFRSIFVILRLTSCHFPSFFIYGCVWLRQREGKVCYYCYCY